MTRDEMLKADARLRRARELEQEINTLDAQLGNLLDLEKTRALCLCNYNGCRCVKHAGQLSEVASGHFWDIQDRGLFTEELLDEARDVAVAVLRKPLDARLAVLRKEFAEL
jgi:hypothetical protein